RRGLVTTRFGCLIEAALGAVGAQRRVGRAFRGVAIAGTRLPGTRRHDWFVPWPRTRSPALAPHPRPGLRLHVAGDTVATTPGGSRDSPSRAGPTRGAGRTRLDRMHPVHRAAGRGTAALPRPRVRERHQDDGHHLWQRGRLARRDRVTEA